MFERADTGPERGGGQEGIPPMATHVGCDYTIAVLNEEGRDDTENFWRKALVDGREAVQSKADVCVYSVGHIFDLRNLGRI